MKILTVSCLTAFILGTFGVLYLNDSKPNDKTTIITVNQNEDKLNLSIEHRHYQTLKILKGKEIYLRFLVNVNTENPGGGAYTLKTDANTKLSVELDTLPAGCTMGAMNLITDAYGEEDGSGVQTAVVVKLKSDLADWSVVNPKLFLDGVYLDYERVGYFSPMVKLNVDVKSMTSTEYATWLDTVRPKIVKIGYIAANTANLQTEQPFMKEIVEKDLNLYAASVGSEFKFEILVTDAAGSAEKHLELVQQFHSQGVNLVIGGGWSSQAQASLNYVNNNNMLLFSASSTAPQLSYVDRLFRMCPDDAYMAPSLVDTLWSYGIKKLIFIQRGDSWGDGIYNIFAPAWTAKGGTFAGDRIRYPTDATDFSIYLQQASDQAAAAIKARIPANRIGVICLAFTEAKTIALQAVNYPTVYDLTWFGADGTANNGDLRSGAPIQAVHMEFLSLATATPNTPEFNSLAARYQALTGLQMGVYTANYYDIGMVLAKAYFATGSTDAGVIAGVITGICATHDGVTGLCTLDEFGDRVPGPFQIWTYHTAVIPTDPANSVVVGSVDPWNHMVSWDTGALGYTPLGP